MDTLEHDVIEMPHINPWRQAPTRDQIQYATDLCRTELPYAERVRTIRTFGDLDSHAISELIERLRDVRAKRMARLRRTRRGRRGRNI